MMKNFTLFVSTLVVFTLLLVSNSANAQLSGSYTIDPNGSGSNNYTTFAAAVSALNSSGVSSAVTFSIAPGTYTERVYLTSVSGASATNTITFDGSDKSLVTLQYSGGYSNRATVVFYGADYFQLKNIDIKAINASYGVGIHMRNHADYNLIENCNINVGLSSSSYKIPVQITGSETSYSSYGYNAYYNEFKNNYIYGGYIGIAMTGANTSSRIIGNKFIGNEITGQYYYGFRQYYCQGTTIQYNFIHGFTSSSAYAIYRYYSVGGIFDANIIYPGRYAFYMGYENRYSNTTNTYITNNMISNFQDASYNRAIYMYYYNYRVNILHNNIWVKGTTSTYSNAAIYGYRYSYYLVIKNNIIQSTGTALLVAFYYPRSVTMDYNDYYKTGSYYWFYSNYNGYYTGLNSWKASPKSYINWPHDQNSVSTDPGFTSYSDLHVIPIGSPITVPALTGVTNLDHDVDGDTRATSGSVMIGADQVPPYDVDVVALTPSVAKLGNNTVTMTVMNKGLNAISSSTTLNFEYSVNGGTPVQESMTLSSNFNPGTTITHTFSTQWNITVDQTYNLCCEIDPQISQDPDTEDKMCQSVGIGLDGIYTIDPSGNGDFIDFATAISALNTRGVAGAVTFNVASGTYNEKVEIPEITGVNSNYTIQFIGAGKNATKIIFTGNSSGNRATLVLNGADYITFKDMSIISDGSTYATCVVFTNHADYNTIKGCRLLIDNTYTGSWSLVVNATSSESSTGGAGDNGFYNLIEDNEILGGYYGIYWRGSSYNTVYGNTFKGNTFLNQYYYGIYTYYCAGTNMEFNTLSSFRSNSSYGIRSYYGGSDTIISNTISPGRYGIYMYRNNYYNSSFHSVVANNMISNFQDPTYQTGIYSYYTYNTNYLNNTIWVDGSYHYYNYAGIYIYYYANNTKVENNILISTGNTIMISLYRPYNISSVDYNMYFHPGSTTSLFYNYNSYYYNLNSFKSNTSYVGTHDQHSWDQEDPEIVSQSNLHLIEGSYGKVGNFYAYPDVDVDDDMRCQLQSYVGADEPAHLAQSLDFIAQDTMCFITPVTFYNTGIEEEPHVSAWYLNGVFQTNDFNFTHSFTTLGYDTVSLLMQTCFQTDTITKAIYIDSPTVAPLSEFMSDKNVVEVGEVIELIDLTDNCPTSWTWEVSPYTKLDPNTNTIEKSFYYTNSTDSFDQIPQIVFNYPGSYTVSLTSKNGSGTSPKETKIDYINVKFSDVMCGQYLESSRPYGNLYDDGGSGNHGTYKNCTYLIKPCSDDVKITFQEFSLGTNAFLRLYDGASNRGTPLWDVTDYGVNGITGMMNDARFDTILLALESGMVYIEFESVGSVASGFKLEWASVGQKTYVPPQAGFETEDTSCIVYPVFYENTSIANFQFTKFSWDYDGNGVIDDHTIDGVFNTSFPGITANYRSKLLAENCGGIDTMQKLIVLINPQTNPQNAEFTADVTKPVVNQDAVTFSTEANRLSCVDEWEWTITPNKYYFANTTTANSENPQIVFTDTCYYDVSVKVSNTNSAKYSTTVTKIKYIKPKIYCTPLVMNNHLDVGISHVKMGDIDNYSSIGIEGYTNYTNNYSTTIILNQAFEITMERNTTFNAMDRAVWIDYNNDGDFTDQGELVASEIGKRTSLWKGTFTVPVNAELGGNTMRVAALYSGFALDPCGPIIFGEYEDYRIFISDDNVPPVLTIIGQDTVYSEVGYDYTDAGATAIDNLMGNVDSLIVTVNNVDVNTVGGYFVTYDVCDNLGNCALTKKRLVVISEDNTPPVITLSDTLFANVNKPLNDTTYTAYDKADGDITDQVVVTGYVNTYELGTYNLSYYVEDNQGLSDSKNRVVVVSDGAAPDIQLLGDNPVYVEIMTPYNEAGVNYSDNYWPTNKITYSVDGLVDTTSIGTYTISYSVTDASGNGPNTISRTVIVWDSTAPVITLKGYSEIVTEVNEPFVDPGVNINDNSHSGFEVFTSGTYYKYFEGQTSPDSIGLFSIFYYVKDAAGNTSSMIARVVNVVDIKCAELTLIGDDYTSVERWTAYTDKGYNVVDNYYPESELIIDTFSNVDVNFEGLYKVIYTATDPSNNDCASIVRLVKVVHTNIGVEEASNTKVEVYPNPTKSKFVIDVTLSTKEEVVINVVDMLGKEITVVNRGLLTSEKFEVDMSNEAAGVYMVKVQTSSKTILKRIVLSK
ncbi:MAG: DUF5011 domain-containing protein [Bacteroidota bacterium]|nr:DUF5011 domain-containing protein [Bacteroidota bacterium]